MKKILVVFALLIFGFALLNPGRVEALETNEYHLLDNAQIEACKEILGDDGTRTYEDSFLYYLQQAFNLMKFAIPLLLIVVTILDLINVVTSQEKGKLAEMAPKTLKRVIYAAIIYCLPLLINFVLINILGWSGTCGIS